MDIVLPTESGPSFKLNKANCTEHGPRRAGQLKLEGYPGDGDKI